MFLTENKTQKFSPHFGVQRLIVALDFGLNGEDV